MAGMWNKHITGIVKKANSTLAVLKRNIQVPSQTIKSAAYKALIRPHLEYCSPVWDPNTAILKNKIEMVQRRSARWVYNYYKTGPDASCSPTTMLQQLNRPLLETRRKIARLTLMYKMANNLVLMSYRSLLVRYPYGTKAMPAHAFVPMEKLPFKLYYASAFFPKTIQDWNNLPEDIADPGPPEDLKSPEDFKASVKGLF